jgi:hypothetical protein
LSFRWRQCESSCGRLTWGLCWRIRWCRGRSDTGCRSKSRCVGWRESCSGCPRWSFGGSVGWGICRRVAGREGRGGRARWGTSWRVGWGAGGSGGWTGCEILVQTNRDRVTLAPGVSCLTILIIQLDLLDTFQCFQGSQKRLSNGVIGPIGLARPIQLDMDNPILDLNTAVPEESIVDQDDATIALGGGWTLEEGIQDSSNQVL